MENITNHLEVVALHLPDGLHTQRSTILTEASSMLTPWMVPVLLVIASWKLWSMYNEQVIDPQCPYPLPPGTMGLPLIGETFSLLLKGTAFFTQRRQKYGPVFKTHVLGKPTIRVVGAENVRKILRGEHSLVTTQWPTSTRMIFGDGSLALSSGVIHRKRRKALTRAFNQEAMTSYVRPIQRVVKSFVSRWCDQESLLAYPECKELTFTIAAQVLVGCQVSQSETLLLLRKFQQIASNIFSVPIQVPGTGLYKAMRARDMILSKVGECLERESGDSTGGFKVALRALMEGNPSDGEENLTQQEVTEAALELLFAGHETTASATCSILMHLANKPEVIDKVCDELHQHGLMNDNDGNDLTYDVINRLTYTNLVVKEILRVSPPIGGAFRKALKNFEVGGYQIPKGWTVSYSIRDTHETSTSFKDVNVFDPDRWVALQTEETPQDYLPFGGGSRTCVGKAFAKLLLKIFLIELVRNCSWRLVKGKTTISQFPVPHPKDNMPINVTGVFRRRAYTV